MFELNDVYKVSEEFFNKLLKYLSVQSKRNGGEGVVYLIHPFSIVLSGVIRVDGITQEVEITVTRNNINFSFSSVKRQK